MGVKAEEVFKDTGIEVIVVTRQTGRKKPGFQELTEENRKKLEELRIKIVTSTEAFGGIGNSSAVWPPPPSSGQTFSPTSMLPYVPPLGETIRNVLRIFCSGVMVCSEITVMAADAGAISMDKNVIAIAGTHRGADTAVLLKPAHSDSFFDIDIHEIIAKPYSRRPQREG